MVYIYIIAPVVGGGLLLIILVVLIIMLRRRRSTKKSLRSASRSKSGFHCQIRPSCCKLHESTALETNVDDLPIGEFVDMEISQFDVNFIREIGKGEFGVVMEATMQDHNNAGSQLSQFFVQQSIQQLNF